MSLTERNVANKKVQKVLYASINIRTNFIMSFTGIMKLQFFRSLSEHEQFAVIESEGVLIGEREENYYTIRLFAFDNFYTELYAHSHFNVIVRTKCFTGTKGLEPYLESIDISSLLN